MTASKTTWNINGIERTEALKIAADYTAMTIAETLKNPENPWYGVDFEATIPVLVKALNL